MNKTDPIVRFRDYSFQYHSQAEPTLHHIDLDIYPGEKILIVGPSGSGKSTLGHCINGLIPFSYRGEVSGSLRIAGLEAGEQTIFDLSRHVGTVLQDSDSQFVGLTAGEDIAFALENDAVPVPQLRERVKQVAAAVDMESLLTLSPHELSGGQKQRTALAGVMVYDVDILLFDEPLANLDPATGKSAIEIIDYIHEQTGKTVVIIEHRLEDVLHRPVDRIVVVRDGQVAADMDADHLLCSGVLAENGIREPLYITALKYAGAALTPALRPGHIDTVELEGCREPLRRWFASVGREPPQPWAKSILRVEDIGFTYDGDRRTLKNISFDIREGEMVSVIGRNGAGKTTLTRLICGFETPTAGRIRYRGEDIAGQTIAERARYIGLVMQNPNQMITETMIADEVGLGLKLRGVDEAQRRERVAEALAVCGLAPFAKWPVSALSFGQKKRVTIASILTLEPRILILDEPTAGQDFRHYTEIMRFLEALNRRGITVLLITHDMHLMLEYTPRAIVLSAGELVADAPASAVLTDQGVIERANLKETSLYTLAGRAGIADGTGFVQGFIDYERAHREGRGKGGGRP